MITKIPFDPNPLPKSFWGLLGTTVISASGAHCGRVLSLSVEGTTLKGVLVLKGSHLVFYSDELISPDGKARILLKADPYTNLIRKRVYDSDGKYIGKVVKAIPSRQPQDFSKLTVKKRIWSKGKDVFPSQISTVKRNILLNVEDEKLS